MRDFVEWDDQLQHFAESTVRAYKIMMRPPQEPVLISCDIELQEEQVHGENLSGAARCWASHYAGVSRLLRGRFAP